MPFGVGQEMGVLDGVDISQMGWGNFEGECGVSHCNQLEFVA